VLRLELNKLFQVIGGIVIILSKNTVYFPNALIAVTCKHYGIKKIGTFDEDFKMVDFLEVLEL